MNFSITLAAKILMSLVYILTIRITSIIIKLSTVHFIAYVLLVTLGFIALLTFYSLRIILNEISIKIRIELFNYENLILFKDIKEVRHFDKIRNQLIIYKNDGSSQIIPLYGFENNAQIKTSLFNLNAKT